MNITTVYGGHQYSDGRMRHKQRTTRPTVVAKMAKMKPASSPIGSLSTMQQPASCGKHIVALGAPLPSSQPRLTLLGFILRCPQLRAVVGRQPRLL